MEAMGIGVDAAIGSFPEEHRRSKATVILFKSEWPHLGSPHGASKASLKVTQKEFDPDQ